MKKMMSFLILCIFFYPISAGYAADGTVTGNSFQSDHPKLNIQIGSEFKYLDKFNHKSHVKSLTGERILRTENEYYIFVSEGAARKVQKVLYIHFRRIETHWMDKMAENKNNLDYDVMNFHGYNFKYFKRIERADAGGIVTKYLMDAGYTVPTCLLKNGFYIIPFKDLWVTINYWEDATPSKMSCNRKYSQDILSNDQKAYLADFHRRALAAISIGEEAKQPPGMPARGKSQPEQIFPQKPAQKKEEAKPLSLAVFHFTPLNMDVSNYGITATNTIINTLKKQSSFVMLDRKDLQTFLVTNDLQQNDRTENVIDIGTRMGLNFVIAGNIDKKGTMIITNCKVIDIEKRKVVFTDQSISAGEANLISNIMKMSDAMIEAVLRSSP